MEINGKTAIYGIVGQPLGHTASPAMHNAAFKALGLNAVYVPFSVSNTIGIKQSIKQLNIRGLSVTIPYKETLRRVADHLESIAIKIGCINTLYIDSENTLCGTNTDAYGAMQSIQETGFQWENKKVLLIGSGGSALAIGHALAEKPISKLAILARNGTKANQYLRNFVSEKKTMERQILLFHGGTKPIKGFFKKNVQHEFLRDFEQTQEYDLIINTTPFGMAGGAGENASPLAEHLIPPKSVVFDIVYNPSMTPLLVSAEQKGCQVIKGYKMLLFQGMKQFELFTGKQAPKEVMEAALLEFLK